jgi:hypothetical protein
LVPTVASRKAIEPNTEKRIVAMFRAATVPGVNAVLKRLHESVASRRDDVRILFDSREQEIVRSLGASRDVFHTVRVKRTQTPACSPTFAVAPIVGNRTGA